MCIRDRLRALPLAVAACAAPGRSARGPSRTVRPAPIVQQQMYDSVASSCLLYTSPSPRD
eukprot:12895602-Alexandrium_andersonii.AAC.1